MSLVLIKQMRDDKFVQTYKRQKGRKGLFELTMSNDYKV